MGVMLYLGKYNTCTTIPPVFDLVPATIATCHVVEWVFLSRVARTTYTVLQVILVQAFTFCNHIQFVAALVLGEC